MRKRQSHVLGALKNTYGKTGKALLLALSLSSLTYSAFKFSSNNRAAEARNFAQQLKDQIIQKLKETLTKQNAEGKLIQKEIRRQEKELIGLQEAVKKCSLKYSDYFREAEDQIITNEVAVIMSATPKEKKQKYAAKYGDSNLGTGSL